MYKQYIHDDYLVDEEFRNLYSQFKRITIGGRGPRGEKGPPGDPGPPSLRVVRKTIVRNGFDAVQPGTIVANSANFGDDQLYIDRHFIAGRYFENTPGGFKYFIPRPILRFAKPVIIYRVYANYIEQFVDPAEIVNGGSGGDGYGNWFFSVSPLDHIRPAFNGQSWYITNWVDEFFPIWLASVSEETTGAAARNFARQTGFPLGKIYPYSIDHIPSYFEDFDNWDGVMIPFIGPFVAELTRYGWYYGGPLGEFPQGCSFWWVYGFPTGSLLPKPSFRYGGGLLVLHIVYMEMT